MAQWLELSTLAEREAVDAVAEAFSRWGQGVAVEEPLLPTLDPEVTHIDPTRPVLVKTYIPLDERAEERRARLAEAVWFLGRLRRVEPLQVRTIHEEDWASAWKEHFHVQRVSPRLVIVPTWREYRPEPDDVVLLIDPGMAFGTGLHPTTRLCLQALERHLRPGDHVLDVGTGSGILAIAAAKLGAARVLALDIEPVAVKVAVENAARNGVADRVTVRLGTLDETPAGLHAAPPGPGPERPGGSGAAPVRPPTGEQQGADGFDLAVANISATVVLGLAGPLGRVVRPGGTAVVSGLLVERADDVRANFAAGGWELVEQTAEGDWAALTFRRAAPPPPASPPAPHLPQLWARGPGGEGAGERRTAGPAPVPETEIRRLGE